MPPAPPPPSALPPTPPPPPSALPPRNSARAPGGEAAPSGAEGAGRPLPGEGLRPAPTFRPLPVERSPKESEDAVRSFWKRERIFEKSLERVRSGERFVFYEGPPTANGMPHHGHVLTRAIKDLFPRYQTMRGRRVERKAGWDTHGLPVEIEVERSLGLEGKQDVERYGVAAFVERCKESVWKYRREWEELTERIGFWLDLEHPYVTYSKEYVESVWWALKTIHEKGLLYKGHKILPWCPRDMTALSSHEVGQGYRRVSDPAITVAFELHGVDAAMLAWTTTPWTLLSNVCLVVAPEVDYVYARRAGRIYVLAAERVHAVLGDDVEILRRVKGADLVGKHYRPLFDFHGELDAPSHVVVSGEFVTTDEGTGVVHAAPAFGEDDNEVCRANGLAFVNLVEPSGRFSPACGPYAGRFVKEADRDIIRELRARGALVKEERIEHEYPHCWRCKTPLLYYAREAWFVRTTAVKDRLVELNEEISWTPERIRDGRFGDFLANNRDWALSRERFWGTPLPVWECAREDCGGLRVVASVAEIRALDPSVPEDLDPHRPGVDEVVLPCPDCGGPARRVPEVIDCWFDSGAMPFAQWGYPHLPGSRERFAESFPADFISEAIDQTRGWFYTLHAIATLLFDRQAYRRCLVLGHVLDEQGKKLSKKDKNYRPPAEVLDEHGADAFRWFFYTCMSPGQGVRFFDEAIRDARRTLIKLLNVYRFFQEYASADGFDPRPEGTPRPAVDEREALDRWVLSFLHSTTARVRDGLDAYDFQRAAGALAEFLEGLSNWYLRRSRERGWSKARPEDASKWTFWWTLYEVLTVVARLLAPFTPFLAEELHRVLEREVLEDAAESVHLCGYPESDARLVDRDLEERMALARRAVALGLSVRRSQDLRVRQPLARAIALLSDPRQAEALAALAEVVADELNVQRVEISQDFDTYVDFDVRVDFRKLGPRFGKRLGAVRQALAALDPREVAASAREGRGVTLDVEGRPEVLGPDELDVRLNAKPGFAAAEEGGLVVVLDTQLTPELVRAGLAREVQSRIQASRKELDLPYDAVIEVFVSGASGDLERALSEHGSAVAQETQAQALHLGEPPPAADYVRRPIRVDGSALELALRVVS
ncbi:MAG: isoleucine--tRNA ligase [Planctomycetota bacterium]|nr:MAG: isoleucine--tRNA ligase [Planctomycetota bacterium]